MAGLDFEQMARTAGGEILSRPPLVGESGSLVGWRWRVARK
jgi:hypothetical protein